METCAHNCRGSELKGLSTHREPGTPLTAPTWRVDFKEVRRKKLRRPPSWSPRASSRTPAPSSRRRYRIRISSQVHRAFNTETSLPADSDQLRSDCALGGWLRSVAALPAGRGAVGGTLPG